MGMTTTFCFSEQDAYILARTLVGLPWEGCPIGAVKGLLNFFDPSLAANLIIHPSKVKELVLPGRTHAF
jgi:hypothetical protein